MKTILHKEIIPHKDEIKDINKRIDKIYDEKKKQSKEGEPEIKSQKELFKSQIDDLLDEKDKLRDDNDEAWDKYRK